MPMLSRQLLLDFANRDPDVIRALFAQLGFSPQRVAYTTKTLGWADNTAAELHGRSFDLVADLDEGAFQVLLLPHHHETNGLSLGLQRRLYATLEARASEGLLVLPNQSWDVFELVLLVDTRSEAERAANELLTFPRFSFDPRALLPHHQRALELMDVHGIAGIEVGQHLLRAFGRAQQETLFRSQNFFSRYYLEQRIAGDGDGIGATWHDLLAQGDAIRAAAASYQPRPILEALGWELLAAPQGNGLSLLRSNGINAALLATLPESAPIEQQTATNDYPQLALIAALEQAKKQKGLSWGVLTNGRIWRLYSTLTSSISGVYYEVDLHDLIEFGDDADLRFFSGFFGARSLATDFARKVFRASQTLAKEVGENLKKTIFERVFEELATGIAHSMWLRGEYTGDEAQRRLIFRATLVLLYRILFLLYAENRRLLPTMHPAYYPHSLTRLLTDIAIQPFLEEHKRRPMGPKAYWAWSWFADLCAAVDSGNKAWGVPHYNGGLFANGRKTNDESQPIDDPHQLLAQTQIGALYFAKALDLLGRQRPIPGEPLSEETARRLVDYAALDVRRLGSIYEGLLEYQLEAAGEDTDGSPKLALPRSSQGRKASGSYYTPDYIVAYIVEQAVGPVLREREQRFADLMPKLAARRREYDRYARNGYQGAQVLKQEVEALEHEASEALLDLKVCDPAMGSGHFLVETVDFLSDCLIVMLKKYPDNPIRARLDAIRADVRASLTEQGIHNEFISDEQLSDTRLLRRLVMKRCVYGVDLNDMAVELARLSLWLHSFTVGAPLSFLDHHLKWGNSLIGARAQDVQASMEKVATGKVAEGTAYTYDMFGKDSAFAEMLNLTNIIEELVQIADANGQQVEQSAALYAAYEQKAIEVKRLLDLWVSQYFGSKEAANLIKLYSGTRREVSELVDAMMHRRTLDRADQSAVERAHALFAQHRFFHWDLEFPEVFIDLHDRSWKDKDAAGFDAVVGNPPYLNAWSMTEADPKSRDVIAILSGQSNLLDGHWDLYTAFVVKALQNINERGAHSFIVPDAIAREKYAKYLREYILKQNTLFEIMHFEGINVFEDVSRHCIIYTIFRRNPTFGSLTKIVAPVGASLIVEQTGKLPQHEWLKLEGNQIRLALGVGKIRFILEKMHSASIKLGQYCYVMVGATIHSKDKKSFTKDTITSLSPVGNAKRFFDGRNIARYQLQWDGRYVDYRRDEMYGPRVPELFESSKVLVRDIT